MYWFYSCIFFLYQLTLFGVDKLPQPSTLSEISRRHFGASKCLAFFLIIEENLHKNGVKTS